jgi:hypothetical protein
VPPAIGPFRPHFRDFIRCSAAHPKPHPKPHAAAHKSAASTEPSTTTDANGVWVPALANKAWLLMDFDTSKVHALKVRSAR